MGETEEKADFIITCSNCMKLFTQRRQRAEHYTQLSGFQPKLLQYKLLGYWLPAGSNVC